ncbi:MAG: S-layer homology domain-containing protein [Acidobacteriota bacterium]
MSPGASVSGTGSLSNPWQLQTALNQPASVHPGDTIWLRGGTYVGTFTSSLVGTSTSPITVRQYTGERATLDGNAVTTLSSAISATDTACTLAAGLYAAGGVVKIGSEDIYLYIKTGTNTYTIVRGWNGTPTASHSAGSTVTTHNTALFINGAYTWFWGFEIMNSSGIRTSSIAGSTPPDRLGFGIDANGPGTKIINMVVHDTGQGIGVWMPATGAEVYGNLVYYNGWDGPDRGHGHGVYLQNQTPSTKQMIDNILLNQFGTGSQAYTEGGFIDNIYEEGNTVFSNGILSQVTGYTDNLLIGGTPVALSPSMISNFTYSPSSDGADNNLGYSGGCTNAAVTGNYFSGSDALILVNCTSGLTMTGNSFYGAISGFSQSQYPNNTYYSSRPTGTWIKIRPNQFESGRANITIYNWGNLPSVSVDLSGTLSVGDGYEIRNTQDFYGAPVVTGTYSGGSVSIPMTGLSVAAPVGWSAPPPTGPEFGAFVLTTTLGPGEFYDVPQSNPFHDAIHTLALNGITAGCGGGYYCPDASVTRAEMAVFLLKSKYGSAYVPPLATGNVFDDVPLGSFADEWIEQIHAEGITAGCTTQDYCPDAPASRAEMAVFLLKTLLGAGYTPPPATGTVFDDVASNAFAAAWIEDLAARGLTAGCGGGDYCPNAPVSRAQMAPFLVSTFNLQ